MSIDTPDSLGEFIKTLPKAQEDYIPPSPEIFRQIQAQEKSERDSIPDPWKAIGNGPNFGTFEIRSPNDDIPRILRGKKGEGGGDNGKSFGLGFQYRSDKYIAGMDIDGYTRNDFFDRKTKLMHGERNDHMQLYALGKVGETQMKIGERVGKVMYWVGGGVQGVGKFGMKGLQTAWHDKGLKSLRGGYNYANTYEVGSDKKVISGYSPDIRGKAEHL